MNLTKIPLPSFPLNLAYNLRLLAKNLGFVAICVITIGLGMGLSVSMYSVLTNIAVKSPPFPDGAKFVRIHGVDKTLNYRDELPVDGFMYQMLEPSVRSFETFGVSQDSSVVISDEGGVAQRFIAAGITPNLLQSTDVSPLMGRLLLPEDDIPGAQAVALISHQLWQSYYNGREDILGITSRIDGNPYTIVGVMPEGFTYPLIHDLWLPLQLPVNLQPGERQGLDISGVLADGIRIESVNAELNALFSQLGQREPEFYDKYGALVQYCCSVFGGSTPGGLVLPALGAALLLLVCVNVANLILVRSNQRVHEFAIRSAVGASRWRIVQAILQDSLIICILGSLFGVFLANMGLSFVELALAEAINPMPIPFWFSFGWEINVVLTTLLIVLIIWLLSSVMAIWKVSNKALSATLAGGASESTSSRGGIGTAILVSFEIVFSCFLLVVTGVLIGFSSELAKSDYGVNIEGYLTGQVDLATAAYSEDGSSNLYMQNLQRELLEQEGIEAVSFASALPTQGGEGTTYGLDDRDVRTEDRYPSQTVVYVAPNYFETMEVSLLAGRHFDGTDSADSLPVVIIDELFAAQRWPGESVIGKRIQLNPDTDLSQWLTVVGVIPHIVQGQPMDNGLIESSLYRPIAQSTRQSFSVVMKVDGESNNYRDALQRAAVTVDRDLPIENVSSLEEVVLRSNALVNFAISASSTIALVTVVLAVTGVFALVSKSVTHRAREIGIRRAIGSSNFQVHLVFLKQGLKFLCLGLLIGGGGAALLTVAIEGVLTGVLMWLPAVFIGLCLGFGLLISIATYLPARLLVALEPGETLHVN